jgi:hypothetical protein
MAVGRQSAYIIFDPASSIKKDLGEATDAFSGIYRAWLRRAWQKKDKHVACLFFASLLQNF